MRVGKIFAFWSTAISALPGAMQSLCPPSTQLVHLTEHQRHLKFEFLIKMQCIRVFNTYPISYYCNYIYSSRSCAMWFYISWHSLLILVYDIISWCSEMSSESSVFQSEKSCFIFNYFIYCDPLQKEVEIVCPQHLNNPFL